MKYPIVVVTWVDSSYTQSGWQDKETLDSWAREPDCVCVSAGLLVYEDDSHVVLALSIQTDEYADCFKIPRVQISTMRTLDTVVLEGEPMDASEVEEAGRLHASCGGGEGQSSGSVEGPGERVRERIPDEGASHQEEYGPVKKRWRFQDKLTLPQIGLILGSLVRFPATHVTDYFDDGCQSDTYFLELTKEQYEMLAGAYAWPIEKEKEEEEEEEEEEDGVTTRLKTDWMSWEETKRERLARVMEGGYS